MAEFLPRSRFGHYAWCRGGAAFVTQGEDLAHERRRFRPPLSAIANAGPPAKSSAPRDLCCRLQRTLLTCSGVHLHYFLSSGTTISAVNRRLKLPLCRLSLRSFCNPASWIRHLTCWLAPRYCRLCDNFHGWSFAYAGAFARIRCGRTRLGIDGRVHFSGICYQLPARSYTSGAKSFCRRTLPFLLLHRGNRSRCRTQPVLEMGRMARMCRVHRINAVGNDWNRSAGVAWAAPDVYVVKAK